MLRRRPRSRHLNEPFSNAHADVRLSDSLRRIMQSNPFGPGYLARVRIEARGQPLTDRRISILDVLETEHFGLVVV